MAEKTEKTAREKFSCPACGGEARWDPAKQMLVCAFCGVASPAEVQLAPGGETIQEHDLAAALRGIPDSQRGWQAEKVSVRCQSCQAISVFSPERVGQRCDFCGSSALIPYEEAPESFRPESLLPFKVSESQVRENIRHWYGSRWFAPNQLKRRALTDQVKGLYIPYWTFDADARAAWTAESGYYYYTQETFRDANGRTQTRPVQHTRWAPSSGQVTHVFDDALVAASRGVHEALLRAVEPYPTRDLVPYQPGLLSGWVVERYQIDLVTAAQKSRHRMDQELQRLCAAQVPGDTFRNLQVRADYSGQKFKHVLVPLWLLTYSFGPRSFQVAVNGYTGQIAGEYPKSWVKITLALLALLVVVLGVAWFAQGGR